MMMMMMMKTGKTVVGHFQNGLPLRGVCKESAQICYFGLQRLPFVLDIE